MHSLSGPVFSGFFEWIRVQGMKIKLHFLQLHYFIFNYFHCIAEFVVNKEKLFQMHKYVCEILY